MSKLGREPGAKLMSNETKSFAVRIPLSAITFPNRSQHSARRTMVFFERAESSNGSGNVWLVTGHHGLIDSQSVSQSATHCFSHLYTDVDF